MKEQDTIDIVNNIKCNYKENKIVYPLDNKHVYSQSIKNIQILLQPENIFDRIWKICYKILSYKQPTIFVDIIILSDKLMLHVYGENIKSFDKFFILCKNERKLKEGVIYTIITRYKWSLLDEF